VKSRRDAGLTALLLGFFAAAWFGWAQAESTRTWLLVGSIVSLVIAALGAVVGFRRPGAESALHDRAKYRRYGIIVGIEFALECGDADRDHWNVLSQCDDGSRTTPARGGTSAPSLVSARAYSCLGTRSWRSSGRWGLARPISRHM
jgi:hypothetical protein